MMNSLNVLGKHIETPTFSSKSFWVLLVSLCCIGLGKFSPWANDILTNVGLYAFSGSITNWLAIHMLFERVPGLYGSGIIPNNFKVFKVAINKMIMHQFFSQDNIARFMATSEPLEGLDLEPIVQKLDYELMFDGLVRTIMESKFGSMVAMFGGPSALEGLREKFTEKLKDSMLQMLKKPSFVATAKEAFKGVHWDEDQIREKIEHIVHNRLEELSPQMVKRIVQEMIAEHLGWLVLWGGVFGGIIGLFASIF